MAGTVLPSPVPATRAQQWRRTAACGSSATDACHNPRRRTLGAALVLLAVLVLAASCRVDIVVDIDVAHDGAGEVTGEVTVKITFDEEVMRWVPDLGGLIVTDGLVGWDIRQFAMTFDEEAQQWMPTLPDTFGEQWAVGERLRVVASKPFSSPAELAAVLAEIDQPPDGSAGLFRPPTYRLGSRDGALERYELTVTVGLDRPVSELVNPATANALEGELFGMPIADIEARAGAPLDELVSLLVQASVNEGTGRLPSSGTMTLNEGGTRVLRVTGELVNREIAAADAEAERLDQRASRGVRIAIIWGIAVAIIAALLVALAVRDRRRRRGLSFR